MTAPKAGTGGSDYRRVGGPAGVTNVGRPDTIETALGARGPALPRRPHTRERGRELDERLGPAQVEALSAVDVELDEALGHGPAIDVLRDDADAERAPGFRDPCND